MHWSPTVHSLNCSFTEKKQAQFFHGYYDCNEALFAMRKLHFTA